MLASKRLADFRRSILGGFCKEKPDPGDVDGYWVERDDGVYDRIDPYWIDFQMVLVPHVRKRKWRMWADHGGEFFIHPTVQAAPAIGFPEFFRQDRDGNPEAYFIWSGGTHHD